jgi:hypothetical protein
MFTSPSLSWSLPCSGSIPILVSLALGMASVCLMGRVESVFFICLVFDCLSLLRLVVLIVLLVVRMILFCVAFECPWLCYERLVGNEVYDMKLERDGMKLYDLIFACMYLVSCLYNKVINIIYLTLLNYIIIPTDAYRLCTINLILILILSLSLHLRRILNHPPRRLGLPLLLLLQLQPTTPRRSLRADRPPPIRSALDGRPHLRRKHTLPRRRRVRIHMEPFQTLLVARMLRKPQYALILGIRRLAVLLRQRVDFLPHNRLHFGERAVAVPPVAHGVAFGAEEVSFLVRWVQQVVHDRVHDVAHHPDLAVDGERRLARPDVAGAAAVARDGRDGGDVAAAEDAAAGSAVGGGGVAGVDAGAGESLSGTPAPVARNVGFAGQDAEDKRLVLAGLDVLARIVAELEDGVAPGAGPEDVAHIADGVFEDVAIRAADFAHEGAAGPGDALGEEALKRGDDFLQVGFQRGDGRAFVARLGGHFGHVVRDEVRQHLGGRLRVDGCDVAGCVLRQFDRWVLAVRVLEGDVGLAEGWRRDQVDVFGLAFAHG